HTLEPLTAAELALYVSHHVAQAGGEPMQLFPPETLGMLYAYSEGIPRLVNNLAETAASVAAARRAAHVAPAVVEEVARKFLGMTGASRHATERAASPVTPPAAPSAAPAVTPPAARSAAPPVPPPAARSAAPPVPP